MHHSSLGYSGTDGNSVKVDNNNFYDNAMGFSTDVFTAAGFSAPQANSNASADTSETCWASGRFSASPVVMPLGSRSSTRMTVS